MKGDFTRDTFLAAKHYRQVLMQQGRPYLDADWNEQTTIVARRDETTACDIVGGCGGPADNSAFGAIVNSGTTDPPLGTGDFFVTPGRYYVDGIQCELEPALAFPNQPAVTFKNQPDLQQVGLPDDTYLLYLDVWRRHVSCLDDPSIREAALGGPDTGTRVKTVWQIKSAREQGEPGSFPDFDALVNASRPTLTAQIKPGNASDSPCEVPEQAGYKGLENQLYRVEIHLGRDADGIRSYKWSRENGSVAAGVTRIDVVHKKVFLSTLGPDDRLGFRNGDFVEILDDTHELNGKPGQLLQVTDYSEGERSLTLAPLAGQPGLGVLYNESVDGVEPKRHPKVRRWEGWGMVKPAFQPLENDIEISFNGAAATYRTGDYWIIPARAATANAPAGDIEWPRQLDSSQKEQPVPQPPHGITHHYSKLGIVKIAAGKLASFDDYRCLWPALTRVPRIFYVSGDGQEVMPDLQAPFKLPQPLIVGVSNPQCLKKQGKVSFTVSPSGSLGRVVESGSTAVLADRVEIAYNDEGLAKCDFYPDPSIPDQQVTAKLIDADRIELPIVFNANLSIASDVSYQIGFRGEYFLGKTFQNLKLTREDKKIDFDWTDQAPDKVLPAEHFCVRWTGHVVPKFTETYTFTTNSDDGVRLWIDDQLVLDDWSLHAAQRKSGVLALKAVQRYSLRLEFFEETGAALVQLYWSSASTPEEVVRPEGVITVENALDDLLGNYSLAYLSGDGQEVRPLPQAEFAPLPEPLRVRVSNGKWGISGAKVRFSLERGNRGVLKSGAAVSSGTEIVTLDVSTDADGVAQARWELEAKDWSTKGLWAQHDEALWAQHVEARLLDPEGRPGPYAVVFDANLSIASQVGYQPDPWQFFTEIFKVQDAIDRLAEPKCCVYVGRGGHFLTLKKALTAVLENRKSICVCLLPGEHKEMGFDVDLSKTCSSSIGIVGCSGSLLTIVERPLTFTGVESFTARNLTIQVHGFGVDVAAVGFAQCRRVEITATRVAGVIDDGILVRISDAETVRLKDNTLEASSSASLEPLVKYFSVSDSVKEVAELFKILEEPGFEAALKRVSEGIQKMGAEQRKKALSELGTAMTETAKDLEALETANLYKFLLVLSDAKAEVSEIGQSLRDIRAAAINGRGGVALVLGELSSVGSSEPVRKLAKALDVAITAIADKMRGVVEIDLQLPRKRALRYDSLVLEDNDIAGTVSLMGPPERARELRGTLRQLIYNSKEKELKPFHALFASLGTLQLRGNHITRITMSKYLTDLVLARFDGKDEPVLALGQCALTDNVITGDDNLLLGKDLSLSCNKFTSSGGESGVVGASLAESAVFVGNQGAGMGNQQKKWFDLSMYDSNVAANVKFLPIPVRP